MIGFRLQLKKLSDGRLILTIPVGYKILLLGIGLLILISLIVTRAEGGGGIFIRKNTIPLIICLVSLLGAAYHERWIFDRPDGRVIHQNGLIVFHSNKVYGIEDLDRVEVSQFIRGGPGSAKLSKRNVFIRPLLSLSLCRKNGDVYRLEIYSRFQGSRAENTARAIAEYCGISYTNQTGNE